MRSSLPGVSAPGTRLSSACAPRPADGSLQQLGVADVVEAVEVDHIAVRERVVQMLPGISRVSSRPQC